MAIGAAGVALICVFCATFAGWVAPHNPFDLATLELSDSMLPPAWMAGGSGKYLLGTDEQGRDVFSALMYGARISLLVGGASVLLSLLIGVTLGLVSGYVGGRIDALIMRKHVLPNVMGPVLVLSTIQVATAILAEATLSFLGVGVSPTSPSLGTFINEGNKQLFSGAWWLVIFPGSMLVMIALSINLFGDWLRDALNPRLR